MAQMRKNERERQLIEIEVRSEYAKPKTIILLKRKIKTTSSNLVRVLVEPTAIQSNANVNVKYVHI